MEKNAILLFEKEKLLILKEELKEVFNFQNFEEIEIYPSIVKLFASYDILEEQIKQKIIENSLFFTNGIYSQEIDSETFYFLRATEELKPLINETLKDLESGVLPEGYFKKDQIYPFKFLKDDLYITKTVNSRQANEFINLKKPLFLKDSGMHYFNENDIICFLGNFKKIIDL